MKKVIFGLLAMMLMSTAFAGTWVKVRGRTNEEAFYSAQQQYGAKFVQRGSCGVKQTDGYVYCDALIDR